MIESLHRYYYNTGLRLASAGIPGQAADNLVKSLRMNRKDIHAWNLLGLCLYRLGKLRDAEYCWKASLELQTEDNPAGRYLSECMCESASMQIVFKKAMQFAEKRMYKKAYMLLEKNTVFCCKPEEQKSGWMNFLGALKILAGDRKGALKAWTAAMLIDPADRNASIYINNCMSNRFTGMLRFINKL